MQKPDLNIPNTITVIRILLTPIFLIFLQKEMYPQALIVFTTAGISDGIDGFLARYFNQRTKLGAFLDPIADKLLLSAAFVGLAVQNHLPGWVAIIVISRDVLILMGIGALSIAHVDVEIRPSFVSKMTTFIQITTVIVVLLSPVFSASFALHPFLIWTTAAVTIASGAHYLVTGLMILQRALEAP